MYNKILVPLDGSKLAESALEHVECIASGCSVPEVVLVSVTEPVKVTKKDIKADAVERSGYHILDHSFYVQQAGQASGPDSFIGDMPPEEPRWTRTIGRMYSQADKYLDRIQRRLVKKGINVNTEVLLGKPADAIVSYAENNGIDLIIMSSHGRSGISRWASGSVAERVFRSACVPVLMVRAPGCVPKVT
jgi:nucleotide-binding universal stress UspA family protein